VPAIDDLTYLGIAVAFVAGIVVALAHRDANRVPPRLRNGLVLAAVALYGANILNVTSNNALDFPSFSAYVRCHSGCPDYLSGPAVNPDSWLAFAVDGLLLCAAIGVGYLAVAIIRSTTTRGHSSASST
jgi:hypothetical protein